jgi:hypothetical protein
MTRPQDWTRLKEFGRSAALHIVDISRAPKVVFDQGKDKLEESQWSIASGYGQIGRQIWLSIIALTS